ncbi:MAG: DUF72 domain-containing protein [Bryobacteraceae bacterium]|nr:DUF72 domain-containing protein [Bryobacteraceae bacterium]
MGLLYAGTSGFAYPGWKPDFYPADVPQSDFLRYYSERLNSVEINYTFHRTPAASTIENWFGATPPDFRFTLKAHQKITHVLRLRNAGAVTEVFFRAIDALRSAQRLGPVLFQLPPNLRCDEALLEEYLALLPDDVRCAFEFRHDSWFNDAVFRLLERRGAALCIAESEKLRVPEVITANFVYWRLRMPDYSPKDLDTVSEKTAELTAQGKDVFVYFKHEENPQSALWAEQLLKRIAPPRVSATREVKPPARPVRRRVAV